MLTAESVRALLAYNPETGDFLRKEGVPGVCAPGDVAGSTTKRGYRLIVIGRRGYFAHRLAWLWMTGEWPAEQVDHKNRNRTDNRWSNLRAATNAQNQANVGLQKNNKSGFKGVFFKKSHSKWCALVGVDGKQKHLGYFDSPEKAHAAYASAAGQLFGEFARV